jgi:steroid 5-alpha reductase family enzyme
VSVWGLRLSAYITKRNWGEGEDRRYVEMREKRPESFPVTSLYRVFWLQAALAWLISLPLLAALHRPRRRPSGCSTCSGRRVAGRVRVRGRR